jgi:hypothetical protein
MQTAPVPNVRGFVQYVIAHDCPYLKSGQAEAASGQCVRCIWPGSRSTSMRLEAFVQSLRVGVGRGNDHLH